MGIEYLFMHPDRAIFGQGCAKKIYDANGSFNCSSFPMPTDPLITISIMILYRHG